MTTVDHLLYSQYSLWTDLHEDDSEASESLEDRTYYGQVHDLIAVHIDPNPNFGLARRQFFLLAHIQPCPGDGDVDAAVDVVSYTGAEFTAQTPVMVNVAQIVGSVGRIRSGNGWGIVDRHNETVPAEFELDENDGVHAL